MIWIILISILIYSYFIFALLYTKETLDLKEYISLFFLLPMILFIVILSVGFHFLYVLIMILIQPLKDFIIFLKNKFTHLRK
jgi:hypothetical protein